LLTFFIWGIIIVTKGGAGSGKAAAATFYFGIKLSLFIAILLGIIGFLLGDEKLAKIFGILWGTDKEFNKNYNNTQLNIPQWFILLFILIVIIGAYGYLFTHN